MDGRRLIGGGPGLLEVVGEIGRVILDGAAQRPFHCLGHGDVRPPPARCREAGQDRLADQFVDEAEQLPAPDSGVSHHEPGPFGFIDGVEDGVVAEVRGRLQELVGERASDDRRRAEDTACVLRQAVEPMADDEPDILRDVELVGRHIGAEAAGVVEEPALLGEVSEDLLDEERVALGLPEEQIDDRLRRLVAGQRPEHLGQGGFREAHERRERTSRWRTRPSRVRARAGRMSSSTSR